MSQLSEDPKMMLEVIAILVRRLGGSVELAADESFALGEYELLTKFDAAAGKLYIVQQPVSAGAALIKEPAA